MNEVCREGHERTPENTYYLATHAPHPELSFPPSE